MDLKEFGIQHVAIIMDGNGRWATEKNLDRMIDYQEAAADLEFGRSLTAYVRVTN